MAKTPTSRSRSASKKTSGAATTVARKAGDKLGKAAETAASGAIVEPAIAKASVIDHPAVDVNARAGVPAESNQIDFNDPTKPQHEAVAENLAAQD